MLACRTMLPAGSAVVASVLVFCLAGVAHGQDTSSKPNYESPEAVFEAAKSGFNTQNWPVFIECVSPRGRDELIGGLAMAMGMMPKESGPGARAKEILEKYLPEDFNPMLVMGSDNPEKAMGQIVNSIKEPEAFFAEALGFLMTLEFEGQDAKIVEMRELTRPEPDDEAVRETATAQVVFKAGDEETTDQWAFEKIGDGWFVTLQGDGTD